MSLDMLQPMDDFSDIYLRQLHDLISEMNTGMDAITSNSVEPLWQSIARQEALCASLAASSIADANRLRDLNRSHHPVGEGGVGKAIGTASNQIRQLNLQYAALLHQSSQTASMLSSLCDNHIAASVESHADRSSTHTWSCDI